MPIFRRDRSTGNDDDSLLLWKVRLFIVGAGLGVAGMTMNIPWVLWAGMAALFVGMLLRLSERRRREAVQFAEDGTMDEETAGPAD